MKTIKNYETLSNYISDWLNDYLVESKQRGFVIGVSGGIDSAVASTLCAKTGQSVIVVEMPIHQNPDQVTLAQNHIKWLEENFENVSSIRVDLTETNDIFIRNLEESTNLNAIDVDSKMLTLSNTRSRLRMVTLYSIAGVNKMLVCGTGNKVEDFGVGFFTKYGDGGVDLSPIADLMKSEVYQLGKELGVSDDIINTRPTDGLWDDGRTDEDQIGCTYDELEWAMNFTQENWVLESGMEHGGFLEYDPNDLSPREREVLKIYTHRHDVNEHKMVDIPVCGIPNDFYN